MRGEDRPDRWRKGGCLASETNCLSFGRSSCLQAKSAAIGISGSLRCRWVVSPRALLHLERAGTPARKSTTEPSGTRSAMIAIRRGVRAGKKVPRRIYWCGASRSWHDVSRLRLRHHCRRSTTRKALRRRGVVVRADGTGSTSAIAVLAEEGVTNRQPSSRSRLAPGLGRPDGRRDGHRRRKPAMGCRAR